MLTTSLTKLIQFIQFQLNQTSSAAAKRLSSQTKPIEKCFSKGDTITHVNIILLKTERPICPDEHTFEHRIHTCLSYIVYKVRLVTYIYIYWLFIHTAQPNSPHYTHTNTCIAVSLTYLYIYICIYLYVFIYIITTYIHICGYRVLPETYREYIDVEINDENDTSGRSGCRAIEKENRFSITLSAKRNKRNILNVAFLFEIDHSLLYDSTGLIDVMWWHFCDVYVIVQVLKFIAQKSKWI